MARAKKKTIENGKELKYSMSPEQKDNFAMALMNNNFNVAKTCTELNVDRNVYYYLLKYDTDFVERLSWSKAFIKNMVMPGLLEGITHSDLTLRLKYLDLLAKSGILIKLLGFEDVAEQQKVEFSFKKEDLIGE